MFRQQRPPLKLYAFLGTPQDGRIAPEGLPPGHWLRGLHAGAPDPQNVAERFGFLLMGAGQRSKRLNQLLGLIMGRQLYRRRHHVIRRLSQIAVVRLELNDGRVFEYFLGEPKGMPGNPMSDGALDEKFRACAGGAGFSSARIERILETFWSIELHDNVSRLFSEAGN